MSNDARVLDAQESRHIGFDDIANGTTVAHL